MRHIKWYFLAGQDPVKYELPLQELLRPEVLGFPFEHIQTGEDRRVIEGSQILETAAAASLAEQYQAARECGFSEDQIKELVGGGLMEGM